MFILFTLRKCKVCMTGSITFHKKFSKSFSTYSRVISTKIVFVAPSCHIYGNSQLWPANRIPLSGVVIATAPNAGGSPFAIVNVLAICQLQLNCFFTLIVFVFVLGVACCFCCCCCCCRVVVSS